MTLRRKEKLEIERIIVERRAKIAAGLQQDVERARQEPYQELAGGRATDSGDQANADLISDLDNAELARDLLELRALDEVLARLTGRKNTALAATATVIPVSSACARIPRRCAASTASGSARRPSRIRPNRKSKIFAHA